MKRSTRNMLLPAACLLATGFLSLTLSGSTPTLPETSSEQATIRADAHTAPVASALRATIDPETGKLTSEVAPLAGLSLDPATAHAMRRDREGLQPVYRADGTTLIHLDGRFHNFSVARIDANGKVIVCSERADQVVGALNGGPAAVTPAAQTPEVR